MNKRNQLTGKSLWILTALATWQLPAWAVVSEWNQSAQIADRNQLANLTQPANARFRLKVFYQSVPDAWIDLSTWRAVPEVNSELVGQIRQVRKALPNWHGTHTITPGAMSTVH